MWVLLRYVTLYLALRYGSNHKALRGLNPPTIEK